MREKRLTSAHKSIPVKTNWLIIVLSSSASSLSFSSNSPAPRFPNLLPLLPANPNFGATWFKIAPVCETSLPDGSFNAGGAKCGGMLPEIEGLVRVERNVGGSRDSVYGWPAYSNARRTNSPRPGIPGHWDRRGHNNELVEWFGVERRNINEAISSMEAIRYYVTKGWINVHSRAHTLLSFASSLPVLHSPSSSVFYPLGVEE